MATTSKPSKGTARQKGFRETEGDSLKLSAAKLDATRINPLQLLNNMDVKVKEANLIPHLGLQIARANIDVSFAFNNQLVPEDIVVANLSMGTWALDASLEADRRSPAILTAENEPERRRSKLETRDCFTLLRRDFRRHRESSFCCRSIVGTHGCRARFRRRCRALELTAGTIELSVIGTLRFELPGQR
ncbi:hypothetical protein WN943_015269 [Citrus x changshan-huyou]